MIETMQMILRRPDRCPSFDPKLLQFLLRFPSTSLADVMKTKLTEPNGFYLSIRLFSNAFSGVQEWDPLQRSIVIDFVKFLIDHCAYTALAANIIGWQLRTNLSFETLNQDIIDLLAPYYDLSIFQRIPPPYSDEFLGEPFFASLEYRSRLPSRLALNLPPSFGSSIIIRNERELAQIRDDLGLLQSLRQTGYRIYLKPDLYRDLSVSDFIQIAPYLQPSQISPLPFQEGNCSMISMLPDLVHWGRIDLACAMLRVRSVIRWFIQPNDALITSYMFYLYWALQVAHRLKHNDLVDTILGLIGLGILRHHSEWKFCEREYHVALLGDRPDDWRTLSMSETQTRYLMELQANIREGDVRLSRSLVSCLSDPKFKKMLQKQYAEIRDDGDLSSLELDENEIVLDYFGLDDPMFFEKCRLRPAPSYI